MPFVMNSEGLNQLSFNHRYWACSTHVHFHIQVSDTRVELKMFCTFLVLAVE